MSTTRLTGPDGLHVHAVETATSYDCWARAYKIDRDAALLVTRRGAIMACVAGPDDLAGIVDVRTLNG